MAAGSFNPTFKSQWKDKGRNEQVQAVPHIPFSKLTVDKKPLAFGSYKAMYNAYLNGKRVALLILRNSDNASLSDMENEIQMCEPVTALMPCGHLCVCEECGSALSTCPICRTPVQEAKHIFGI